MRRFTLLALSLLAVSAFAQQPKVSEKVDVNLVNAYRCKAVLLQKLGDKGAVTARRRLARSGNDHAKIAHP